MKYLYGKAGWLPGLLCIVAFFAMGCGVTIIDPGKQPGEKEPVKDGGQVIPKNEIPAGVFARGEGTDTELTFLKAVSGRDGSVSSAYVFGRFKHIAHFGDKSVISEGSEGAFLARIAGDGSFTWVKSYSSALPGGLALSATGGPVIALGDKGVSLIEYSTEGKELRKASFPEIYRASGLRLAADGSAVFRAMSNAGKVEFGKTSIRGNGRQEASYLARVDADWKPMWAWYISADYNNSFQPYLFFDLAKDGALWIAADSAGVPVALEGDVPATFKGGAFAVKLDRDGKSVWKGLGDSITGHGKRFSNQKIRHLSIDQNNRVHLLGQILKGTFAGKEFNEAGLFHFVLDDKGQWLKSFVKEPVSPLRGLVNRYALSPDGRVFLWGESQGLTFPLPGVGQVSPADPFVRGIWEPESGKMTWEKAKDGIQGVAIVSNKAMVRAGAANPMPGPDALPESGNRVFVEGADLTFKTSWRAQTAGGVTIKPLDTKVLKDGTRLLLVAWIGHLSEADKAKLPSTRYLLHVDANGKLLRQRSVVMTRLQLDSQERLYYMVKPTSNGFTIKTKDGNVTVPGTNLAVVFEDLEGVPVKVVAIPAQGAEMSLLQVHSDGSIFFAGLQQMMKAKRQPLIARYNADGTKMWRKSFAMEVAGTVFRELLVTAKGEAFLVGQFYHLSKDKDVKFDEKSFPKQSNPVLFAATFGSDGTVLSAQNASEMLCNWEQVHATIASDDSAFVAASCRNFGKKEGDVAVVRLGIDGKVAWKQKADGAIKIAGVMTDAKGQLQLVGHFEKTLSMGGKELSSKGQRDAFLASFGATGELGALTSFGGVHDDLVAAASLVGGKLAIAGTTRGQFQVAGIKLASNGGLLAFQALAPLSKIHK